MAMIIEMVLAGLVVAGVMAATENMKIRLLVIVLAWLATVTAAWFSDSAAPQFLRVALVFTGPFVAAAWMAARWKGPGHRALRGLASLALFGVTFAALAIVAVSQGFIAP